MTSDPTRDIEDTPEALDTDPGDSFEFWAKKQREIISSVVDYNLGTITDLIRENAIDLDPTYQRRFRWDAQKQSRLIESFLMNVPVPPVFLNEDEYGKYSIIDGKQRLSAVNSFLGNNLVLEGLKVFLDINGMKFSELPTPLRNILRTRPTIRAIIILRQSDKDVKYEVFQRLNTGGVTLNAQEIRNNAFHGRLNTGIMELAESRHFHNALGIRNKHRSAIYREMRDAEFVLRFFAFKDNWESFRGGMKRHMDTYMEKNRNISPEKLDRLSAEFTRTIDVVTAVFGDGAFRRWLPEKRVWRKQVIASLYDAQMFACQYFKREDLEPSRSFIVDRYKSLFEQEEFRRSIDAATNTPTYFKARINDVKKLLQNV